MGTAVFAGLVWTAWQATEHVPPARYMDVLNDLTLLLLFGWPVALLLAFINQWVLHLVLVEHGAYRPGSPTVRLLVAGALLLWIAALVWFFAMQRVRS
jgi:hypothetical protein